MSDVFPATTEDERDPREDQNEDRRREEFEARKREERAKIKRYMGFGVGGVVAIAALSIFFGSWYTVDEGERAVAIA